MGVVSHAYRAGFAVVVQVWGKAGQQGAAPATPRRPPAGRAAEGPVDRIVRLLASGIEAQVDPDGRDGGSTSQVWSIDRVIMVRYADAGVHMLDHVCSGPFANAFNDPVHVPGVVVLEPAGIRERSELQRASGGPRWE
eukprot:scaffold5874_cov140-Isochrysis_galbana.AAC.3